MNGYVPGSNAPWLFFEVIAAFTAGAGGGIVYFGLLKRTADIFAIGGTVGYVFALYLLRFGVAGAVLYLAARFGVLPLLATLFGILAARHLVVPRIGGGQ